MIIKKELKNYTWEFNDETKELTVIRFDIDEQVMSGAMESITLDKIRWFSLFRFMIRASQRMSVKRRKQQGLFNKKK